jgi:N-dimethylarginine dimethylaminohydrolase
LKAVVLGTAKSNGPIPLPHEAYDPKSLENIKRVTYPNEADMFQEMESVARVFEKYSVTVYRPELIQNYNQIFSRDIAFVIDNNIIKSHILPERDKEIEAIRYMLDKIPQENLIKLSDDAHIEGGDVLLHNEYIFIGTYRGLDYHGYITARTNMIAVKEIQLLFSHKKVKSFNLRKNNTNPRKNALHLDCCFQPVGKKYAIIHPNSFLQLNELHWLYDLFGEENCFKIDDNEMYEMMSNIFSISEDVVISDSTFHRLNTWLRERGITVEEVYYREVAKQGGLFRCSTLPLVRA